MSERIQPETRDQAVQYLLDVHEIEQVITSKYTRALDWKDPDLLKECFHPDAEVDYGFIKGNGTEFCEAVMPFELATVRVWHYNGNVRIEIDGDVAHAESYGFSVATHLRTAADGADPAGYWDSMYGGRYLDQLERRESVWRLSRRTFFLDWSQVVPSGFTGEGPGKMTLSTGLNAEHPLYRPLNRTRTASRS